MTISFISFKDYYETCTMHTKSTNVETMIGNETDEIIREFFVSLLERYQERLAGSTRES